MTLLALDDVARRLGVSRATLYRMIHRREIAAHRSKTGRLRISEDDLAAYQASTRLPAEVEAAVERRAKITLLKQPDAPTDKDRELARKLGLR